MKEFQSLREFNAYLIKVIADFEPRKLAILNAAGQLIEDVAKKKIGHLQGEVGPFKAWDPLAESTKLEKERLGYVFNADYNPLYRTGDLQDSIHHAIFGPMSNTVFIGSSSDIMIYQELGTVTIPARSVLGAAAFESQAALRILIKNGLEAWILQKSTFTSKPDIK